MFGVYDPAGDCARMVYYGLYALQHRGQEACGIATINDRELSFHKDVGLVGEVFTGGILDELGGTMAVGHTLHQIAPDASCGFCDGCFTGHYPISLQ